MTTKLPEIDTFAFHSLCSIIFEKLAEKGLTLLSFYWKKYPVCRTFDVFRLLIPELDSRFYGIKEQRLIDVLKVAWNLSPSYVTNLQTWRQDCKSMSTLDFAMVVSAIAEKIALYNGKGKVSVKSLNELLDSLQAAGRETAKHVTLWRRVGTSCTPLEIKWLVRIILKEMKVKMSYQKILKGFHPHALELYNTCTNLQEVCEKCNDSKFIFSSLAITTLKCFKPMLATVVPSEAKLNKQLANHTFVYEQKYDGERIMIHFQRDKTSEEVIIKYFTRNSKDYTSIYAKKFDHIITENVKSNSCVLDGEMMVWSNELGAFKEFGTNRTFALSEENTKENFCFCVFDIIVYNDIDISQRTLKERRKYLEKCVVSKENSLLVVPQTPLHSAKQALEALKEAVLNRDEGIMIKNLDSQYNSGERSDLWMKLKPDYIDAMGETLDLLIIGGYWGTKFQRRSISHFLLGIQVSDNVYYSIAKVGSGYTNQELLQLQHALQPYWKPFRECKETMRLFANWKPGPGEIPDVYLLPENSRVLEIKANSIVESSKFKMGVTLRFPRVKCIREDKDWNMALTLKEFQALQNSLMNGGLNNFQKRTHSETDFIMDHQSRKKRRIAPEVKLSRAPTVLQQYVGIDTSQIERRSQIFRGLKIYVINADAKLYSKQTLETMIHENGGKKVQNPTKDTSFLVAAKREIKVNNWIKSCENGQSSFDKDVVHYKYLIDCIRENKLITLHPSYMIYTSKTTQSYFKHCIDRYGDAFTIDATPDSLKGISVELFVNTELIQRFNRKYAISLSMTFFRGYIAYFDRYACIGETANEDSSSILKMMELYFKLYSGDSDHILSNCTHIVVDKKDQRRWKELFKMRQSKCQIVNYEWIRDCCQQRKIIPIEPYEVNNRQYTITI